MVAQSYNAFNYQLSPFKELQLNGFEDDDNFLYKT
jgi:hypothetical protein